MGLRIQASSIHHDWWHIPPKRISELVTGWWLFWGLRAVIKELKLIKAGQQPAPEQNLKRLIEALMPIGHESIQRNKAKY